MRRETAAAHPRRWWASSCKIRRRPWGKRCQSWGACQTGAATRLVYTIGLIKWVTLGLIALGVLGATALGFTVDSPVGGTVSLIVWIYGAAAGLST